MKSVGSTKTVITRIMLVYFPVLFQVTIRRSAANAGSFMSRAEERDLLTQRTRILD